MNYTVATSCNGTRRRRLVRSLTLLWLLLCAQGLAAQVTVTSRVTLATDDMEEIISTGVVDGASSDLELVNEGGGDQIIALRFPNLNIPAGAAIKSAYIQFTADETNAGATILTFRAEASDSALTFGTDPYSLSPRTLGSASVSWNVPAWNVIQEKGADQRTPNLRALVQEAVNRSGWKANNAIAIFIGGTGKRVAESQEGATSGASGHDASQAPTLTVEYVMPTVVSVRVNSGTDDAEENIATGAIDLTSSDLELTEDGAVQQYIAMRFANMNIPKDAIISSAYIQFATDELFSDPTSLVIRGIAADNPGTFTTAAGNISSRAITSASAAWSPAPWTVLQEADAKQRTTDLSALIQEIVNRSGWNPGNAMAIRINGTGRRTAEAYDGSAGEAPQLVVRYYTAVRPVAPVGTFPVPRTAVWKYLDDGSDPGTAWRDPAYNADSTWAFGAAQLGYGDGDEATQVGFGPNAGSKNITTYFRHNFTVADKNGFDSLRISLMRDDGAVVYLNGVEIVRSNMPAGTITNTTPAASNVGGADESAYFTFMVGKEHLVAGMNVLAVEVHQDAPTTSDLSFSLALESKKNDVNLITSNTNWEYKADGVYPGANWYKESFNDTSWNYGASPLGYGNGNEATLLEFGADPRNKRPAAYFRRNFVVNDTAGLGTLLLRLRRDDGAIVYLNGVELLRNNMPAGAVDHTTLATAYVEGAEENEYLRYYINRNLLKLGSNLIAVEVHQNSATSTDMAFDLELIQQEGTRPLTPLSIGTPVACNNTAIGCFTSLVPTVQQEMLVIPPTHTFQVLVKSGRDKYTGTNKTLPGGNDFTGYIPDGRSSTSGHLSINHENTPGGVSVVDLKFDAATSLWKTDTIKEVDFSPVVTTVRNCSGGVTPWGTVITSEETYSTGDANRDGYEDIGWNVEIDPVTGRVRDLNGDGKPDKLWMVGRMNHENVCPMPDSVTLYQGEDGGTGCVYKFVAYRPGRLDSGRLYVLRRDAAGTTTGTWIQVPNATQADRNTVSTVAGALGGTRWGGVEDVEFGPDGKIYFTEKNNGNIWRFRDNGTTVSEIEAYVSNKTYPLLTEAGVVNERWETGNDNLAFDGEGNLWMMQDGGRDHMWMISKDHTPANPKISVFGTTPAGSEPTGITFSPDHRFMFVSFQNPSGSNTASVRDAAGTSYVFNASTTVVIARKEHLGAGAIAPKVNLGPDIVVCQGETVRLKYANPDALAIWSDNTVDSVMTVISSGRYSVTVIGNNGQIARDTVEVLFKQLPQISLGQDRVICEGTSYTFSLDPSFSYVWEDGTTSRTRTVNRAGTFRVTATTPEGCSSSDTMTVSVVPALKPSLGADRTICRGSSTTLSAGAGFAAYFWSTGATSPTIQVSAPGTYWVRGTNANGCESFDTVTVETNAAASLGSDLSLCEGSSTTLSPGTGFASYLWSDGSTAPTLRVTAPGQYWVRVSDDGGCQSTDTMTVTRAAQPGVNLGRDTVICASCTVTLDAGEGYDSYLWSNGATSRTITVNQSGNYSVTVRTAEGCSGYDEIDVTVRATSGVDEISRNERFSLAVYPNPFTSEVNVSVELKSRARLTVEIFDMAGRRIATLNDGVANAGRHEFKAGGETLGTSGVYMLKVSADGKEISRKLVRQ